MPASSAMACWSNCQNPPRLVRRGGRNRPQQAQNASGSRAVLALSASPTGFTASQLAQHVCVATGQPESEYGARRAAYDIKKLRGKGTVNKIGNHDDMKPF
jgi:hypothetical protein